MRGRTTLAGTATVMLLAVGVLGCAEGPSAPPATPDPIRLGALMPLSGTNWQSGREMHDAAQLAVREANEAGGVLGRPVELIVGDDACDPGTAVVEANRLVAADIVASVGGYCSSATVATLKIFRTAGVPMIIPLSNSTELLKPGYDSIFLISGTVAAEGEFAIAAMQRLNTSRLAVVHDGTSFPITLAQAVIASAAEPGSGVTVVRELALSQGAPDYARIAAQVMASGADTVYYTGYYGEANRLIIDLHAVGFQGKIMVGDGGADGHLLKGLSARQTRDVYGTALMVPELMPTLAEWSARYSAATGRPPAPSAPEAYDAVRLALHAIEQAGTTDREAVRTAIAATTDLNLLSGPARFNADGTRIDPTFLLLQVREGRFAEVPAG